MDTTVDNLLERLRALIDAHGAPRRFVVMLSGGRDSTVLLHALVTSFRDAAIPVVAAHVNHHLHADSDAWQTHCAALCSELDIDLHSLQVTLPARPAGGIEATARDARYRAVRKILDDSDWLLSAHHEDDQAETLLLNLMRGSGPAGLAGIGEHQRIGAATLVRPFRNTSTAHIAAYAERHALHWIEDPTNDERRFDRNFLRHDVLPVLASRWPAVSRQLARSAALAGESAALLDELAAIDLAHAGTPARLSIDTLRTLTVPRQRNLLRHAIRQLGLPPVPLRSLAQITEALFAARDDATPLVRWSGGQARRYQGHVYLLAPLDGEPVAPVDLLVADRGLELGAGLGHLSLPADGNGGISREHVTRGLHVRYRTGGEKIRVRGQECTQSVKKLMQARGIVPWMRARVPLLYAENALLAVADLWLADDCYSVDGHSVRWTDKPALF